MFLLTGFVCLFALFSVAAPIKSNPLSHVWKWLRSRLSAAAPVEQVKIDESWTLFPGRDDAAFRDWIAHDDFKHPHDPRLEASLGCHLLVEFYGCEPASLEQEESVRIAMVSAAERSNASVVTSSFHEFKPYGVSGAVIIQESHFTIHTWPENRYAAVDLFYCSDTVHVDKAVEVLRDFFKPERTRFLLVRRGLQSEVLD